MNLMKSYILVTYDKKCNCSLTFSDTLVNGIKKLFSIHFISKVLQSLYHIIHVLANFPTLKVVAFYTFVNRSILVCSYSHSFSSEIHYLQTIAIDRSYNFSIIDTALHKLQLHSPSVYLNRLQILELLYPTFRNPELPLLKFLNNAISKKFSYLEINSLSLEIDRPYQEF